MRHEEQCCNIEQAKRLKELGVVAHSIFKHFESSVGSMVLNTIPDEDYLSQEWYAYTVAELGAMLFPTMEQDKDESIGWELEPISKKYGVTTIAPMFNPVFVADCLIHLLEQNLITAEECNNRLSN